MLPFLAAIAPFAPLIGGAVSAVSSLFRSDKQETTTTNTIDFVQMRADAEKAGFNPLAVLRAGAAAGYGTTRTIGPALSFGDRMADAGSIFGSAVASWSYDPNANARWELEQKLGHAQIKAWANTGTKGYGQSLDVPSLTAPKTVTVKHPWASDGWVVEQPELADTVQLHYGDAAEEFFGIPALIRDMTSDGLRRSGAYDYNRPKPQVPKYYKELLDAVPFG